MIVTDLKTIREMVEKLIDDNVHNSIIRVDHRQMCVPDDVNGTMAFIERSTDHNEMLQNFMAEIADSDIAAPERI